MSEKEKALFESFVEGFSMGGKRRDDRRLFFIAIRQTNRTDGHSSKEVVHGLAQKDSFEVLDGRHVFVIAFFVRKCYIVAELIKTMRYFQKISMPLFPMDVEKRKKINLF